MRVLVIGAGGFIGRNVTAGLLADGFEVAAALRRPQEARRRFPGIRTMACDLRRDTEETAWRPRLAGIDAVVNCAGVLQSRQAERVHVDGPRALFAACEALGVRRVIHISAISATIGVGTDYARTKLAAEHDLAQRDLDWVILRPSLVYAEGSFGGTSLLRGLAGFPAVTPLPGRGDQLFDPIHVEDLTRTVATLLRRPDMARLTLEPAGPERMRVKDIVAAWRAWLGLPPARPVAVPMPWIRVVARLADLGGGPMSSTALRQLEAGNTGDSDAFAAAISFRPRAMSEMLSRRPSHVQDRWQARLYFLRPLTRFALAALWLASGVIGSFVPPSLLAEAGIPRILAWISCALDIAVGLAVLGRFRIAVVANAQVALVLAYTITLSWLVPALWLDPFGPLLKNIPILILIGIWAAMEEDR